MDDELLQSISSDLFKIRIKLEELADELNNIENTIDEEI